MVDAHDQATALLPGIPPRPTKPPRTNAAQRMQACAYQPASKRPSCAGCSNADQRLHNTGSYCESETLYCKLHRFDVGKHAVCADWSDATPARKPQSKRGTDA